MRRIVFAGGPANHCTARTALPAGTRVRVRGVLYVITDTWTVHGYVAEICP